MAIRVFRRVSCHNPAFVEGIFFEVYMMKKPRALLSAIVLASATLVSQSAFAAPVENVIQEIELENNEAFFGNLFTGGNAGATFSDRFDFTTSMMGDLTADLFSMSGTARNGLDITGYSLYNTSGELLSGTQLSTGIVDSWSLSYDNLAAGSYYVMVNGSVLSNAAGKYYANIALAPVPEPETYAMMLAGLGLLGFTARRRKQKEDKQA